MPKLSWIKFVDYARTQGVIIEPSGRNPAYDMWHEKDYRNIHSVDNLDEAVESLHELLLLNGRK